jgi:hypothetical protein
VHNNIADAAPATLTRIQPAAARGPTLAGAFLAADLVDRVVACVAPLVLGAGRVAVEIPGVAPLADARRFRLTRVEIVGDDVRLVAERAPGIATPADRTDDGPAVELQPTTPDRAAVGAQPA